MSLKKVLYIILPLIICLSILFFFSTLVILNYKSSTHTIATDYNARKTFDFNYGWSFSKGQGYLNSGSSAMAKEEQIFIPNTEHVYDTAYEKGDTWKDVSLPHTFNDEDTFDNYVESLNGAVSQNGERTMYTGTAWYKKQFYLPQSYINKKIYIEFEAARQSAQIWVNGNSVVGNYVNGFVAFGYDLTNHVLFDADNDSTNGGGMNEITVLVDNSYPYYVKYVDGQPVTMYDGANSKDGTALPWHDGHWHPNYGGLYRNSWLHITEKLQLTLPLYSFMETEGTYVWTSNENGTAKTATINVKSQIANYTNATQTFTFKAEVFGMNDTNRATPLLTLTQEKTLKTSALGYGEVSGTLNNVIRWDVNYPYLYTVVCSIYQNGVLIDNNETQIGVRTFRFTTDHGFLLNENFVELKGWGQKPTSEWAGIGASYSDWMTDYTIKKMKDAGGNYLRWGHCAGSQTQISACDKYGIIVAQSGVDGEGVYGGNSPVTAGTNFSYKQASIDVRKSAFRDLVIEFRNNPSIVLWEIGNQSVGSFDDDLYNAIYEYINQYDFGNRVLVDTNDDGIIQPVTDKVANVGSFTNTAGHDTSDRLLTLRQQPTNRWIDVCETTQAGGGSADKPDVESEYNRWEVRRGALDNHTSGFENFTNTPASNVSMTDFKNKTMEDYSIYQVRAYYEMVFKNLNYLSGGANWIFSDSISHARMLSEVCRASGEVDATFLEKDAYYVDKVLFNKDKTSHIIGHWNYNAGTIKSIYVVSKAPIVKLTVTPISGASVVYTSNAVRYGFLHEFPNVEYLAGTVSVAGYEGNGTTLIASASDSITTHGVPTAVKITVVNDSPPIANGADYLLLDVEVIDANGRRCTTYSGITYSATGSKIYGDICHFSLSTPQTSVWVGGYNSSEENSIHKKDLYIEAGVTRVAIRTTKVAGTITLTAILNGYTEDTISVNSVHYTPAFDNCNYTMNKSNRLPYNLVGLNQVQYGVNNTVDEMEEARGEIEMESIDALEIYDGTSEWGFAKLASGNKIYFDKNYYFYDVPQELNRVEYLQLSADSYKYADNSALFSFTALKTCKMFIFLNKKAQKPIWIDNSFAKTTYVITSSEGVIYDVYYKNDILQPNTTYSVNGSAIDSKRSMFIVGFLRVNQDGSAMQPNDVLYFNEFSEGTIAGQFSTYFIPAGNASFTVGKENEKTFLHIHDEVQGTDSTSAVSGIKEFASQTEKFSFEFDLKLNRIVNSTTYNNNYSRIFIQQGGEYDVLGSKAPIRLFFDTSNSNGKINVAVRLKKDASTSSPATNYTVSTGEFNANEWYTFKLEINLLTKSYMLFIKPQGGIYTQLKANGNDEIHYEQADFGKIDHLDHIMIASGQNGMHDFDITNIKITKPINNIVQTVTINGVVQDEGNVVTECGAIPSFYENTFAYYINYMGSNLANFITNANFVPIYKDGVTGWTHSMDKSVEAQYIYLKISKGDITYTYKYYFGDYSLSEFKSTLYMNSFRYKDAYRFDNSATYGRIVYLLEGTSIFADKQNFKISSLSKSYSGAELFITNSYMGRNIDGAEAFEFSTKTACKFLAIVKFNTRPSAKTMQVLNAYNFFNTNSLIVLNNGDRYIIYEKDMPKDYHLNNFNYSEDTFDEKPVFAIISNEKISENKTVEDITAPKVVEFEPSNDFTTNGGICPVGISVVDGATNNNVTNVDYSFENDSGSYEFIDAGGSQYTGLVFDYTPTDTIPYVVSADFSLKSTQDVPTERYIRFFLSDSSVDLNDKNCPRLYLKNKTSDAKASIAYIKAEFNKATESGVAFYDKNLYNSSAGGNFTIKMIVKPSEIAGEGTISVEIYKDGILQPFIDESDAPVDLAYKTVGVLNKIVIATGGTGIADFVVRNIKYEEIKTMTIHDIASVKVNGTPLKDYSMANNYYMWQLNEANEIPTLDTITAVDANGESLHITNFNNEGGVISFDVLFEGETLRSLEIFLLANTTNLEKKVAEVQGYTVRPAEVIEEKWTEFTNAKTVAQELLASGNYNPAEIENALLALNSTFSDLQLTVDMNTLFNLKLDITLDGEISNIGSDIIVVLSKSSAFSQTTMSYVIDIEQYYNSGQNLEITFCGLYRNEIYNLEFWGLGDWTMTSTNSDAEFLAVFEGENSKSLILNYNRAMNLRTSTIAINLL